MASQNTSRENQVPVTRQNAKGVRSSATDEGGLRTTQKNSTERHEGENLPGEDSKNDYKNAEVKKIEKKYEMENTVLVNVEGRDVDSDDIIDSIEELCGEETVMACVPCGKNVYEVTMIDKDCRNILLPTFNVGEISISACSVNESSTVVSILHLPTYVTDYQIAEKMEIYKIQIVSPIYRKFRRRNKGNRKVADGTRFFRVKFPKGVTSLPWSLSFQIDGVTRYFKTIHDNQAKVCYKCCSAEHIARDCDQNRCYTCNLLGHIAINCPTKYCSNCNQKLNECECEYETETDDEEYDENYDETEGSNDSNSFTEMMIEPVDQSVRQDEKRSESCEKEVKLVQNSEELQQMKQDKRKIEDCRKVDVDKTNGKAQNEDIATTKNENRPFPGGKCNETDGP